jgi:Cu2+-exporting ATPase
MEATSLSSNRTHHRSSAVNCDHCGAALNGSGRFCCAGCEAAYTTTHELSAPVVFSTLATETPGGDYQLELGVEGIHCASCIRLIENALVENKEVVAARVNMSTERLNVAWQGPRERGDALAQQITALGYKLHDLGAKKETDTQSEQEKSLIKAIAVAGFAAGNLMLLSVGLWTSTIEAMGTATRELFHWLSALIALPTVAYAGQVFFRSAVSVLRSGHTNMDVPISIAVILACFMSISETLRGGEHVYFDSAVMLLFFLLIGRYLDARAKGKARQSASTLLSKLAGTAAVYQDNELVRLPVKELKPGMRVLVAAGENVPADGAIHKGESEIDLSLINGETMPAAVTKGSDVFAGTLNLMAPIELIVAKASSNSLLSEIVRMMEVAEQGAAKYVRLADRAASLYTPVVHAFGALTFLGWWLVMSAPWQISLLHAVTVLIITCPCALGLAVPVVQVLASSELLKNGILLKSGDALERLSGVNTIVFDKTGTLTLGCPELVDSDFDPDHLQIAASLATQSRHPLSKALAAKYNGALLDVTVDEQAGKGLSADLNGSAIRLGSRKWCGPAASDNSADLELWLSIGGQAVARYVFVDQIRQDAAHTIRQLHQMGLRTALLSGDRSATATKVARSLGIPDVVAEVSPTEKCEYLNELRTKGKRTLMVGDGLNDAPALAAADASMSPSSAIDIAQNTADIVFQGDKLAPILKTVKTARRSTLLVKQNFGLAVIYNIIAIPLAVAGYVTPLVAAAAMSGSSLLVILNAFRLKRKGGF